MIQSFRDTRTLRLLRAIIRANFLLHTRSQERIRERWDFQYSEFDLIMTLGNTGGMRMGDVAARMLTSAPNVTRIVKRLEEKGLVTRTRAPLSNREVICRLTDEGDRLFREGYPEMFLFEKKQLDELWDEREQEQLIQLLERALPPEYL